MKIFIDLGAYIGDTVEIALEKNPEIERAHAFEPDHENYTEICAKFKADPRVVAHNAAATAEAGKRRFYQGAEYGKLGGSLLESKSNVDTNSFTEVQCIDFSEFLKNNTRSSDHVILKIDIEGGEYELLERLIETEAIYLVKELFVEWHWSSISYPEVKHNELVTRLRNLGFPITGAKELDEYILVANLSPGRIKLLRWKFLLRKRIRHSWVGAIIQKVRGK